MELLGLFEIFGACFVFSLEGRRVNLNNYSKLSMETFQSVCCFYTSKVGNNEAQYSDKEYSLKGILHTSSDLFQNFE